MQDRELTPKQRKFVLEYVKSSQVTKSAIAAGYSAKSADQAGSRLLKHPRVRAELDRFQAKLNENTSVTLEALIEEYKIMAFKRVRCTERGKLAGLDALARMKGMFPQDRGAIGAAFQINIHLNTNDRSGNDENGT